jgi:hypothetical protein
MKTKLLTLAVATLGLVACSPAEVSLSWEEDGATLPVVDNGEDGPPAVEVYEGGGWKIDTECNEDIASTGNEVGDITSGTALTSQFGDTVDLSDFCGRAVYIVTGAFW